MRYVVVGDIGIDTILTLDEHQPDRCRVERGELCLAAGQKIPAVASHQTIGGNAANVTFALDRLGSDVRLISHVGDDWSGKRLRSILQDEGISTDGLSRSKEGTNHSTVLLCEGERTIITYHAVGDYKLDKLRLDDWVILCSMGEKGAQVFDRVLALESPIVYLPGTRQVNGSRTRNRRVIRRSEIVVVNLEEAQTILDARTKDPVILASRLLEWGAREAVVTSGKYGAVAAHETGIWQGSIWHQARRVDPTGAGDAFAATYVWARLAGSAVAESLKMAAINAGSVVADYGSTTGLLKRTKIAQLIKDQNVTVHKETHER